MAYRTDQEWLDWLEDAPSPPASQLLGFEPIALSVAEGWFECSFIGRQEFLNPGKTVQGGFVSAMLDDVMSFAAVISMDEPSWVPTLQMTTSFIRPALPGRLLARGEVIRKGRAAVHTQGFLHDEDNRLLAQAVASCIPRGL